MKNVSQNKVITFPEFSGVRCLMMPYIQGEPDSVPQQYKSYQDIIKSTYTRKGDIGFITIDESPVSIGMPHRGNKSKHGRALHTEVGRLPEKIYCWGGGWGKHHNVILDYDVRILLANNLDDSCAVWDSAQEDTSIDGDIGYLAEKYPYNSAIFMKSGEVYEIGIFTPHESLPVKRSFNRQFLRIVSSGVHGREEYFTENPLMLGIV